MSDWKIVYANKSFEPQGDVLNFREMKCFRGLSKVSTLSFGLRLDNPLAAEIASTDGYIKAYRNGSLVFYGNPITVQEVGNGDEPTLKVNAVGPEWKFTKVIIGESQEGNTIAATTDLGEKICAEIIIHGENPWKLHIIGNQEKCALGKKITQPFTVKYKYFSEFIEECYDASGGFDWTVSPTDNWKKGVLSNEFIGEILIKEVIGVTQENAIFEWGTGRNNIANFAHTIDRTTMLNSAINFPSAGPTSSNVLKFEDAASKSTYGLYQEVIQSDVLSKELREALIKENVEVRKNPRKTITFEPVTDDGTGRVPTFGKDFELGDSVQARIKYNGIVRLNALVRVWGIEFLVDENLKEIQKLTLSNS